MATAKQLNARPGDVLRAKDGRILAVYDTDVLPGSVSAVIIVGGKWTGLPGTVGYDEDFWAGKAGTDIKGLKAYKKSIGV